MSPRFQNILDLIFAILIALSLFGGLLWGVVTLVQSNAKANDAVSFINSESTGFKLLNSAVASQEQQTNPATAAASK